MLLLEICHLQLRALLLPEVLAQSVDLKDLR